MPDSWANWKDTWKDLESKYGLKHMDTDMSSAQELAKFKAEKDNASADIGDVGAAFGPIAVQQGVSQPYKPSTWEQIPAWAKDQDGHWAPRLHRDHRLHRQQTTGEGRTAQLGRPAAGQVQGHHRRRQRCRPGGQWGALPRPSPTAATRRTSPGLEFFGKIAKQGRLSLTNPVIATLKRARSKSASSGTSTASATASRSTRSASRC